MKKLTRKVVRFKGWTLGLDVHKKFIQYSVFDQEGNEIENARINSERAALLALLERLCKRGLLQAALEACGCFLWIFEVLVEKLGRAQVHVAQPSRLAVIANSMEKNDANDAWWLAYVLYEGRLPEAFVAEGAQADLRIAEREWHACTRARTSALVRIKAHLAQLGLKVPARWYLSKCGRKTMSELLKTIKDERGKALRMLLKTVAFLSKQRMYWKAELKELAAKLPAVKVISENMPGMAEVISATVYGELGDPQRFYNQKAYSKGTGLTPGYRKSAGRESKVGITRQGSALARWALTSAAICCMKCKRGPGLAVRRWIEHQSQYKLKKKVIVAAARKLAEGIWRLFALGEVFDLEKAFPVKAVA